MQGEMQAVSNGETLSQEFSNDPGAIRCAVGYRRNSGFLLRNLLALLPRFR